MTWQPGRDRIADLLQAAELERVTADRGIAQRLLDDASRHLATAAAASSSGDLSGAYQLAYDALRKSAASLLAVQGLGHEPRWTYRNPGSGLGPVRLNRARLSVLQPHPLRPQQLRVPQHRHAGPSSDDVTDAITAATQARDAAVTILQQDVLTEWQEQLALRLAALGRGWHRCWIGNLGAPGIPEPPGPRSSARRSATRIARLGWEPKWEGRLCLGSGVGTDGPGSVAAARVRALP